MILPNIPIIIIVTNAPSKIHIENSIVFDINGGLLNGKPLPDITHVLVRLKDNIQKNKTYVIFDLEKIIQDHHIVLLFQIEKKFKLLRNKLVIITTFPLNIPFPHINVMFDIEDIVKINKECHDLLYGMDDRLIFYFLELTKAKYGEINKDTLTKTKQEYFENTSFFESIKTKIGFKDIGGNFKIINYFNNILPVLNNDLKHFNNIKPQCFLFVGITGTGKTMMAEAIAHELKYKLLLANITSLFSKYVGETEYNTKRFFNELKHLNNCVVLIDEIDKLLSGYYSYGETDAGVMSRILGTFLVELQKREFKSIIIATSNEFKALPPALVRKGRWDEIFYFDYPNDQEKSDIIKKICNKYHITNQNIILKFIEAFKDKITTGADIEAIIKKTVLFQLSNKKGLLINLKEILKEGGNEMLSK